MPKGPKGQKRPADVVSAAVMVARIATGEIEDVTVYDGKDPNAVARGKKGGAIGGKERAKKLSKQQRVKIAKKAIKTRWDSR